MGVSIPVDFSTGLLIAVLVAIAVVILAGIISGPDDD